MRRWRQLLRAACPSAVIQVSRGPVWRSWLITSELAYDLTLEEMWITVVQAIDFERWERANLEAFSLVLKRRPEDNSPEVCAALGRACSRLLSRIDHLR